MEKRTVYLDYNATTPVAPEVAETVKESLELYGNPSSMHSLGRRAGEAVSHARGQVAGLIGAKPEEVIFTGCGSESNNTVTNVLFCRQFRDSGRNKFIASAIEHPSIHELDSMLKARGIKVVRIPVDAQGKIRMDVLEDALDETTAIVSVMTVNNEIGTIQDIRSIADKVHAKGAYMHTDAVQAAGKMELDVDKLQADYLSLSGHKIYAPKGIGALYIREGAPFIPYLLGGHQENERRAGTYNTTGIMAMGTAAELAGRNMEAETRRIAGLRDKLEQGIFSRVERVRINGHKTDRAAGTANISFYGAEGESILLFLDMEGISVSTGSACATGSLEPSHVLIETGLEAEWAHGSIRFSLGRFTVEEDVDYVIEKVPPIIDRLRRMSTL